MIFMYHTLGQLYMHGTYYACRAAGAQCIIRQRFTLLGLDAVGVEDVVCRASRTALQWGVGSMGTHTLP